VPDEDYRAAAPRLFRDAEQLSMADRQATACHLYGLAAECALKHHLQFIQGAETSVPWVHLPDIADRLRLHVEGRRRDSGGLRQLLKRDDYMQGWSVHNRYWPDSAFDADQHGRFKEHARRTLIASGVAL
jgi:hypothetical protein